MNISPNEYQKLAAKSINKDFSKSDMEAHSLHGMVGKIGELHMVYQRAYQGCDFNKAYLKKLCGELLWLLTEYCIASDWTLEGVMQIGLDATKR